MVRKHFERQSKQRFRSIFLQLFCRENSYNVTDNQIVSFVRIILQSLVCNVGKRNQWNQTSGTNKGTTSKETNVIVLEPMEPMEPQAEPKSQKNVGSFLQSNAPLSKKK